ncbi:site-specific DNA recombinase [Bacillus sp. 153480037-1]
MNTTATKKVIGIYIRVSTRMQVEDGFSLDAQKLECTQVAQRIFGQDIEVNYYVDEGISAKSTDKRLELQRMMKGVKHKNLNAVITYKASRLSRSLSDSLKLVEDIHNAKVRFISVKEGEYGTPHGNLQFNILVSVAQYQREELSENVQSGMSQRAREGKLNGGSVLGYRSVEKELVIITEEAETVKMIFDKFVHEGWGTKKIANYLNSIGMKTKKKKNFTVTSVSIILDNPLYKGYVRFNQVTNWEKDRRKGKNENYIIAKGTHKSIVDEETWEKAKEIRKRRATGTPRQYSGTFPLTSIAKCPECGSYMTSLYGAKRKDGTKKRYYVCGQYHNSGKSVCNPNTVCADYLENAVFERLIKTIQSDSLIEMLTQRINEQIQQHPNASTSSSDLVLLQKQLSELEAKKGQIQSLIEAEVYTIDEAKDRMNDIRTKINNIKELIENQRKETPDPNMTIKPVTADLIRQQIKEFLQLKDLLSPIEFRQLLVASIEKIDISNKELDHIHFSFIAYLPESEKDLKDPSLHSLSKTTPIILRGLYFKSNHYLFVIRFPPHNPKRPINLLHQHQPHQLMRKRHPRKR